MNILNRKHLCNIIDIALQAGKNILKIYHKNFSVEIKEDCSPLTIADKKSHEILTKGLKSLFPNVPILSEEGYVVPYEKRKTWEYLWLIDPIDGTKEFINKNGEFTVNIALIKKNKPILGIIYVPVKDVVYYAIDGFGAYKIIDISVLLGNYIREFENNTEVFESERKYYLSKIMKHSKKLPSLNNLSKKVRKTSLRIVCSRSHMSLATKSFIDKLKDIFSDIKVMYVGSAIKLCMVAEGKADLYPNFGPTMEWDVAAGQIILEQAGGRVLEVEKKVSLRYNKVNLLNPYFIGERSYFIKKIKLSM